MTGYFADWRTPSSTASAASWSARDYRNELLDQQLFASPDDVREATYWWMIEYNEDRSHDALGNLTALEARAKLTGNSTFNPSA